jgi:hypothetical protein
MATESIAFLTRRQRFWMYVDGCEHRWSFPQTDRRGMSAVYAANAPYDSHQQCPDCGAMRLFDSKEMKAGPFFTKKVKQHG